MARRQINPERAEELSERIDANEPLIDTRALDMLDEADLPLRGELRQRFVKSMRAQVRERRTVEGIAARASNALVTPISSALEQELDGIVRDRIQNRIEQAREVNHGRKD